jgi:hypothetical protein
MRPLFIVSVIGGLGNQLFQYAFGRAQAARLDMDLRVDTHRFSSYPLRRFLLDRLRIEAPVATRRELAPFLSREGRSPGVYLRKVAERAMPSIPEAQVLTEGGFAYQEVKVDPERSVLASGYWQSERYFSGWRTGLLEEFRPRNPPRGENARLEALIGENDSVCVHVRRGDFANDPRTRDFHGLCGPEYYREALSRIRDSDGHPAFFVFSDDLDWARSNLPLRCQEAVFVGHNGPELPWEDLRLMSLCRRFILANSSFSWWAAWLCRRRDREVLAPRAWFSPASGLDTRDLCPPDWVRL